MRGMQKEFGNKALWVAVRTVSSRNEASDDECADIYDEEQLGRKVSLLLWELFGRRFNFTIDVNLIEGILRIVRHGEK
jgi:hypothetical protein